MVRDIPCRVSQHIDADLWPKLIVNAALNAISAVVHVPYGRFVATPEWRETVGSSTARDLARGTRTEIDALNGFVVRRGASRGVPTPVNQSLVALVKLREGLQT